MYFSCHQLQEKYEKKSRIRRRGGSKIRQNRNSDYWRIIEFFADPLPLKNPPHLWAKPTPRLVIFTEVKPSAAPYAVAVILIKSLDLSAKPIFPEGKAYWIYDNDKFTKYTSIFQQEERGGHRGERMLKWRKMRHVRFFLNETLFPLCGVSLVRANACICAP